MSGERISHMEHCLHCGSTTSSAGKGNDLSEKLLDRYIGLAIRAGDVAALDELAKHQMAETGLYGFQSGAACGGTSALIKLRRMRVARKALQAAEAMLEPQASDEIRYDVNGHVM